MTLTPEEIARDEAIVEAFNAAQHAPDDEAHYDRVLGLARNDKGEAVALLRSRPDENGEVSLVSRDSSQIATELQHGVNARTSPGFYDIGMKRDGYSNDQIVQMHTDNERVLERAQRQLAQADVNTLPTIEEAQARFSAVGYQPPAADGDFVSRVGQVEDPRYRGVIGYARDEDGEAVALIETRRDISGATTIMAMSEQELSRQIAGHESVIYTGGMSDSSMLNRYRDAGFGMDASDRVVENHRENRSVLQGALGGLHDTLASGVALPTVQDAVQDYRQSQAAQMAPTLDGAVVRPVTVPTTGI